MFKKLTVLNLQSVILLLVLVDDLLDGGDLLDVEAQLAGVGGFLLL